MLASFRSVLSAPLPRYGINARHLSFAVRSRCFFFFTQRCRALQPNSCFRVKVLQDILLLTRDMEASGLVSCDFKVDQVGRGPSLCAHKRPLAMAHVHCFPAPFPPAHIPSRPPQR